MKRLILAGLVVAALAGCKSNDRNQVAEERQDVAQAQQEAQKDLSDTRQENAEKIQREEQDVAQAQQEQREQLGSETGAALSATGVVTDAEDDAVKLRTASGEEWELKFADNTQVLQNNEPINKTLLTEGSQVRATYRMKDGDRVAERVEVTQLAPSDEQKKNLDELNDH